MSTLYNNALLCSGIIVGKIYMVDCECRWNRFPNLHYMEQCELII